jgi:hypothetical protein
LIGFVGPADADRTLLARRIDWRFLLPNPKPSSVTSFAGGTLGRAVRMFFGDPAPAAAEAAELVIVDSPSPESIRRAYDSLAPGGVCYAEWRSLPALFHRRRIAELVNEGFADVRLYAVRPDPERSPAGVWIPIDGTAPTEFFLARHPAHRWWMGRLLQAARRRLWRLGGSWRITSPLCAIARRPWAGAPAGEDRESGYLPEIILDRLRGEWDGYGLGEAPGCLETLLLTPGGNPLNKLVFLVFEQGVPAPIVAVKLGRVESSAVSLDREADALAALEAAGGAVRGVPRLLFREEIGGTLAIAETAVSGTRFDQLIGLESLHELAGSAAEWLVQLSSVTSHGIESATNRDYVDGAWHDFATTFGTILDAQALEDGREALESINGLQSVREQRDFSPWNVWRGDDGSVRVLDWESSVAKGLPALDLIYFLTYCAFYIRRPRDYPGYADTYRQCWRGGDLAPTFESIMNGYALRTGVPRELLAPLRLLTWTIHSRSEHERMITAAGGTPPPEMLRQSLFLRLFEEELAVQRAGTARSA